MNKNYYFLIFLIIFISSCSIDNKVNKGIQNIEKNKELPLIEEKGYRRNILVIVYGPTINNDNLIDKITETSGLHAYMTNFILMYNNPYIMLFNFIKELEKITLNKNGFFINFDISFLYKNNEEL
ncbi:hypothetical protein HOD20_08825 [archaeon]|jgi:hypothetical protein|nr:hypothetical protein [archaeon]MBT4352612.1 hypothetical protein [archaeon]MBT4648243.1 hypothetical protein [archaeon]MBT6820876.1 hypothetical protein [archaeon]MBT7392729.1 hypothetical protein [archaeon]